MRGQEEPMGVAGRGWEQSLGEAFFLFQRPFWLTFCLDVIIPIKLYKVLLLVDLRLVSSSPSSSTMYSSWLT